MIIGITFAVVLLVSLVFAWTLYRTSEQETQNTTVIEQILTYEDCVAAGYPILETFPEQCKTDTGISFTRELSEEEKRLTAPQTGDPL
jgi:hypothetical protein